MRTQHDRKWTAYASSSCHYCGGKADTQDHIVPRSILPKPQSRLPYWFRSQNIVPACKDCNGFKSAFRSDCECKMCNYAWNTAIACFLTEPVPPTIQVLRSPANEKVLQ